MTAAEAAKYMDLSPGTLANYRSLGVGPKYTKKTTKDPGPPRVHYAKRDIDRWVKGKALQAQVDSLKACLEKAAKA